MRYPWKEDSFQYLLYYLTIPEMIIGSEIFKVLNTCEAEKYKLNWVNWKRVTTDGRASRKDKYSGDVSKMSEAAGNSSGSSGC